MSLFSRNSLLGGQATSDYANTPFMDTTAKKSVVQQGANANLLLNSRDRNTGNRSFSRTQPYNDFVLQKDFPILQGQINSIKVTEVMMPIPPNINTYNNTATIYTYNAGGVIIGAFDLTSNILGVGFYTGNGMAQKLNSLAGIVGLNLSVTYNNDGSFSWINLGGGGAVGWGISPLFPWQLNVTTVAQVEQIFINTPYEQMGLLWTLGFNNFNSSSFRITQGTYRTSVATMLYTQYVDICSDTLTQYQELTDTSSEQRNPNHILCRLYIADEISKASVDLSGSPVLPGTIYTTIHRQFDTPKVIRWNGQNSVDRVDLRLFDDVGRLLYIGNNPSDFQITLSAVEI